MKTKLFLVNEFVVHPERHLFSSMCSKGGHSRCRGRVTKSRNPTGVCFCPCHKIEVDKK